MKIAVIGTGLIGSQVVDRLVAAGHDATGHSRATGVDLLTEEGLDQAVRLPSTPIQPISSAEVAAAVAEAATEAPLGGAREVGCPEVVPPDELGHITLAATGDGRRVVTDETAPATATGSSPADVIRGTRAAPVVTTRPRAARRARAPEQVTSAVGGHVVLSSGEEFDSELIVWTAGDGANPGTGRHTDLPVDERGLIVVRPDLRAGAEAAPVPEDRKSVV